jgi:hypothetical protein
LLNKTARGLHTADAPKAPAGTSAPHDGATHLFVARCFLIAGKLRQALLNLCYAMLYNEQGGDPDPVFSLDVWTLRAEAAWQNGDSELAEHCLHQAFILGAGHKTFGLLADFLLQQGRRKEAKAVVDILRTYKSCDAEGSGAKKSELLLPEGRALLDADKPWWRLANDKA